MDKYLTVGELADRLSVKRKTVYGWVQDRKIPYYKLGGCLRFKESEIEKWAEKRRTAPLSARRHAQIAQDILTRP